MSNTRENGTDRAVLLCRAGSRVCGLPLESVVETLRPLATESVSGAPPFVVGVAVVRGRPTPVIDASLLIGATVAPVARWVLCRVADRHAVLAVSAVVGVATASATSLDASAPILDGCAHGVVESLAVHDRALLLLLSATRWIPASSEAP